MANSYDNRDPNFDRYGNPRNKGGRMTTYTDELADLICDEMINSSLGLYGLVKKYHEQKAPVPPRIKAICGTFPRRSTLSRWSNMHTYFRDRLKAARTAIAEERAENISNYDVNSYVDDKGVERADPGMVSLMKARIKRDAMIVGMFAPHLTNKDNTAKVEEQNEELKEEMKILRETLLEKHKKDY